MRGALKVFTSVLASTALFASTTVAATTASQAPATQAKVQAPPPDASNPWMALSVMSSPSTQAVALGQTNVRQSADQPPSTLDYVTARPVIGGEVVAFGVWFVLIIIALSLKGESGGLKQPTPISPT